MNRPARAAIPNPRTNVLLVFVITRAVVARRYTMMKVIAKLMNDVPRYSSLVRGTSAVIKYSSSLECLFLDIHNETRWDLCFRRCIRLIVNGIWNFMLVRIL